MELPDPTPGEAQALVLGAATFSLGWGLCVLILFLGRSALGVIPLGLAFAGGIWLYFGGAYHVAARQSGEGVGPYHLRHALRPWNAFTDPAYWSWLGAILPSYIRRSARVLGWPEAPVLAVLGALVLADLVLFVVAIVTAPSDTGR